MSSSDASAITLMILGVAFLIGGVGLAMTLLGAFQKEANTSEIKIGLAILGVAGTLAFGSLAAMGFGK